jgi:hypothetical protein
MRDGVHMRLMVTRGVKRTPYQDPRVTIGPATIVIIPEHKNPLPESVERGLSLFTVHVRRGYPDVQDPKLNSHSKLNCITACIQAIAAGADEAFVTGTFAGVVPVHTIDGRTIGDGKRGPMVERLQSLYRALVARDVAARRAPQ